MSPTGNRMSYAEIEKDEERQEAREAMIEQRYEAIRENLADELEQAKEIIDFAFPRVPHSTSHRERLEVFALRLMELSELAKRLSEEFP